MPKLSIILPTYNRGKFITTALSSIIEQTFSDWELIIVDDGSTDDTKKQVETADAENPGKIKYFYQENGGAYAARKAGLAHASGELITFYDSDDLWVEHHLEQCVMCLNSNPDIDWIAVRGCHVTGTTDVDPKKQEMSPFPSELSSLESRWNGELQIIDSDRLVETLVTTGHSFGLPLSVIRRHVFDIVELHTEYRNGEDRMFLIRALKSNTKLAILHCLHYIFLKHAENSSAASLNMNLEQRQKVYESIIHGYEGLLNRINNLTRSEQRALRKRISHDFFWKIGYNLNWQAGQDQAAFAAFKKGIKLAPFNLRMRKTLITCRLKQLFGRCPLPNHLKSSA